MPAMTKTARFLTLQMWETRVDDMLATRGAAAGAAAAWHPGDPHWDAEKAKIAGYLAKAVDDLLDAPEPESVVRKSFTTVMSDADADALAKEIDGAVRACAKSHRN